MSGYDQLPGGQERPSLLVEQPQQSQFEPAAMPSADEGTSVTTVQAVEDEPIHSTARSDSAHAVIQDPLPQDLVALGTAEPISGAESGSSSSIADIPEAAPSDWVEPVARELTITGHYINEPLSLPIEELRQAADLSIETLGTGRGLELMAENLTIVGVPRTAGSHQWRATGVTDGAPTVWNINLIVQHRPLPPREVSVTLPNAQVAAGIYTGTIQSEGVSDLELVGEFDIPGLELNLETLRVVGTPTQPGDYTFKFRGQIEGAVANLTVRLSVIPDPKSLWKNIQSDPSAPFWKFECDDKQVKTNELLIVGASQRGRSHADKGTFRDDDFGIFASQSSGWHVGIACDGKGSGAYSREGSRRVVEKILELLPLSLEQHVDAVDASVLADSTLSDEKLRAHFLQPFWNSVVTSSFEAARYLKKLADTTLFDLKDFDTTLIVVVAKRLHSKWLIASLAIGDGGAAVVDLVGREVTSLMTPDSGAAAGETRFLTVSAFQDADDIKNRLRIHMFDHFDYLVLGTDGITDAKIPTERELEEFESWANLIEEDILKEVQVNPDNLNASKQLLHWLNFFVKGEHDDRTIIMMRPIGASLIQEV